MFVFNHLFTTLRWFFDTNHILRNVDYTSEVIVLWCKTSRFENPFGPPRDANQSNQTQKHRHCAEWKQLLVCLFIESRIADSSRKTKQRFATR